MIVKTAICHSQILGNSLYFKNRCIILSNAHLLYYLAPIQKFHFLTVTASLLSCNASHQTSCEVSVQLWSFGPKMNKKKSTNKQTNKQTTLVQFHFLKVTASLLSCNASHQTSCEISIWIQSFWPRTNKQKQVNKQINKNLHSVMESW